MFSKLLKYLIEKGEYKNLDELAQKASSKDVVIDRSFISKQINLNSLSAQKIDLLFEQLTKGIDFDDFIKALEIERGENKKYYTIEEVIKALEDLK